MEKQNSESSTYILKDIKNYPIQHQLSTLLSSIETLKHTDGIHILLGSIINDIVNTKNVEIMDINADKNINIVKLSDFFSITTTSTNSFKNLNSIQISILESLMSSSSTINNYLKSNTNSILENMKSLSILKKINHVKNLKKKNFVDKNLDFNLNNKNINTEDLNSLFESVINNLNLIDFEIRLPDLKYDVLILSLKFIENYLVSTNLNFDKNLNLKFIENISKLKIKNIEDYKLIESIVLRLKIYLDFTFNFSKLVNIRSMIETLPIIYFFNLKRKIKFKKFNIKSLIRRITSNDIELQLLSLKIVILFVEKDIVDEIYKNYKINYNLDSISLSSIESVNEYKSLSILNSNNLNIKSEWLNILNSFLIILYFNKKITENKSKTKNKISKKIPKSKSKSKITKKISEKPEINEKILKKIYKNKLSKNLRKNLFNELKLYLMHKDCYTPIKSDNEQFFNLEKQKNNVESHNLSKISEYSISIYIIYLSNYDYSSIKLPAVYNCFYFYQSSTYTNNIKIFYKHLISSKCRLCFLKLNNLGTKINVNINNSMQTLMIKEMFEVNEMFFLPNYINKIKKLKHMGLKFEKSLEEFNFNVFKSRLSDKNTNNVLSCSISDKNIKNYTKEFLEKNLFLKLDCQQISYKKISLANLESIYNKNNYLFLISTILRFQISARNHKNLIYYIRKEKIDLINVLKFINNDIICNFAYKYYKNINSSNMDLLYCIVGKDSFIFFKSMLKNNLDTKNNSQTICSHHFDFIENYVISLLKVSNLNISISTHLVILNILILILDDFLCKSKKIHRYFGKFFDQNINLKMKNREIYNLYFLVYLPLLLKINSSGLKDFIIFDVLKIGDFKNFLSGNVRNFLKPKKLKDLKIIENNNELKCDSIANYIETNKNCIVINSLNASNCNKNIVFDFNDVKLIINNNLIINLFELNYKELELFEFNNKDYRSCCLFVLVLKLLDDFSFEGFCLMTDFIKIFGFYNDINNTGDINNTNKNTEVDNIDKNITDKNTEVDNIDKNISNKDIDTDINITNKYTDNDKNISNKDIENDINITNKDIDNDINITNKDTDIYTVEKNITNEDINMKYCEFKINKSLNLNINSSNINSDINIINSIIQNSITILTEKFLNSKLLFNSNSRYILRILNKVKGDLYYEVLNTFYVLVYKNLDHNVINSYTDNNININNSNTINSSDLNINSNNNSNTNSNGKIDNIFFDKNTINYSTKIPISRNNFNLNSKFLTPILILNIKNNLDYFKVLPIEQKKFYLIQLLSSLSEKDYSMIREIILFDIENIVKTIFIENFDKNTSEEYLNYLNTIIWNLRGYGAEYKDFVYVQKKNNLNIKNINKWDDYIIDINEIQPFKEYNTEINNYQNVYLYSKLFKDIINIIIGNDILLDYIFNTNKVTNFMTLLSSKIVKIRKSKELNGIMKENRIILDSFVKNNNVYIYGKVKSVIGEFQVMVSAEKAPIAVNFEYHDLTDFNNPDLEKSLQILEISNKNFIKNSRFIFKSGDECKQDTLALQLISLFQAIFDNHNLNLILTPYIVLSTSFNSGLIRMVPNSISRNSIGQKHFSRIKEYYIKEFSQNKNSKKKINLEKSIENFRNSFTAYSLICYFLDVKDRHNGNILYDDEGRIIHIDFGFIFDLSPGGIKFEVPIKISDEVYELLNIDNYNIGSNNINSFQLFKEGFISGFLLLRKYVVPICNLIEKMSMEQNCLKKNSVEKFRKRFLLNLSDKECIKRIEMLIEENVKNKRIWGYDMYQFYRNDIEK